jgi:anti-anti-sigma factor
MSAAEETGGAAEVGGATWAVGERPNGRIVAVAGEFDLAAEQPWLNDMNRLFGEAESPVGIDLSGVSFMDSSGVRALIVLRKRYGDRFVVEAVSDPVQQLLEMTGVLQFLGAASRHCDEVES